MIDIHAFPRLKAVPSRRTRRRSCSCAPTTPGKSRVAEAYLREIAGDRFDVSSPGTTPADSANSAAVEALAEKGLSLREGPGVALTPEDAAEADLVVTFGCEVGDITPQTNVEDWPLTDESDHPLKDYGQIRDAIAERVADLTRRLEG